MEKYEFEWYFGMPNTQNRERLREFLNYISPKCSRSELKRARRFFDLLDLINDFDLSYCYPKYDSGILALEWYIKYRGKKSFSLSTYLPESELHSISRSNSSLMDSDPRESRYAKFRDVSKDEIVLAYDTRCETHWTKMKPLNLDMGAYVYPSHLYGIKRFKVNSLGSKKVKKELRNIMKTRVNLLHGTDVKED
jgi:hypothetical protein